MPNAAQIEWPQGNPLFQVQWRAVAESLAGNGIQEPSHLAVTATANALEIQVDTGTAFYIGQEYTLGSASTFTLSSGDSDDRWDTVYFDTATSSAGVREGTAGTSPEPPDVQGDELLLAVIYVPAGATDVPDADILNWRAQFSNEAEEINYDDSSGIYGINTVDAALDALQYAAQISAYPLEIGDLNAPYAPTNIASVNAYPFANSDLANSAITVNTGSGLTTTNASIGLGGSADIAIPSGGITTTELNNPYALPTISDMDAAGNDLTDSAVGATIWDTSEGHIPRPQIDDNRVTVGPLTSNHTTSGEEVALVDTSSGAFTLTLASADVENGNYVTVVDVAGAAETNNVTIETEGSETIDGVSSKSLSSDYGAVIYVSNGTNWFTAGGSAVDSSGISIEDSGTTILSSSGGIDFGNELAVTDNGDGTVRVDSDSSGVTVLDTGVFNHTGGSSTSETIAGVTTDQTENLYVEVGVNADPSFDANYAWDYDWGEAWDNASGEKDVTIDASWDTDPGSGNDVELDYRVYTLDVSISKSRVQSLVDSPNGNIPTALLEDTESIEISVPVPNTETLKVYRWGAYKISDGTAPAGLEVQLLGDSDNIQASENTVNTESTTGPVVQHGNASGSLSIFKLRINNNTGNGYTTDGIGGLFAYVVE